MSITWDSSFSAAGDPVSPFAAPHAREVVWLDDGKHLIKKGGRVTMSATVQHQSREVHFATTEILLFAALLLLSFGIV
ncbi:uncharacterized protein THITE_2089828 [Thermothielavioides terrestris NRRL 8126]|uniref:Uncharacterized protein n=1 Tax=Thermothielavioides terrestris (strain ATCC 38088 / NRRL 8126) TaxID=578455 RepID=G2R5P0_THETT|nr:uncharacterized protein THITE_2089828 [Thermothielavioides terrestris NRRL 8126]AEO68332.1 hypothetical protein THITE_2089828 [Thermothielavioides terrestris NRRL 8126]